ncbi:MAG: hypothetical protein HOH33_00975 [Verrucomicrobia bacterium]|nr:hypothetical protein [Verrucomicrobiota bacterium]
MPENPIALQGEQYEVNIYGLLFPSHLEVQFIGRKDGKSRIIPFDQIITLEFGEAGITFDNP